MRNLINSYTEFLNESKLELLLEANIKYLPEFMDILNEIDSPISDKLISLSNNVVNVNTNYINIDTEKEDYITFLPDDKIEKKPYTVIDSGQVYDTLSIKAQKDKTYDIGDVLIPNNGTSGIIVKELTIDELCKISPGGKSTFSYILDSGNSIVHFRWTLNSRDENQQDNNIFFGNILILKKALKKDLSDIKRIDFRIGKFVSKILTSANIKFTLIELEDFVDKYKTIIQLQKVLWTERFKIVKGEDIRYWYDLDRYLNKNDNSSLGSSCMRYERCQPYFDIYTDNTDVVQMVILMAPPIEVTDETGEISFEVSVDKICGRAILWTDINGRKIMDRIYVNKSSDVELFKKFASKNGFYYKSVQDYNSDTWLEFNGKLIESAVSNTIVVQLKRNVDYRHYPYMDTLKYYNIKSGIITNDESERYDYELEDTDGTRSSCDMCDGGGRVYCHHCEQTGEVECRQCDGSGLQDCGFCDGEKIVSCPECHGNDKDCEFCKGSNEVDCPECDGRGSENCYSCDGSGDVECPECDGNGEFDCPEC